MPGLLGDVLPWAFSQGDRAKRYVNGLLSDPIGTFQQTAGQIVDNGREMSGLLDRAWTDPAAQKQATQMAMAGLLGFAPVGMTVKSAGMKAPYEGSNEGPAYQIDHKPMTVEGGAARLHDLESAFGPDIYGPNARQYYGSGGSDVFGQAERAVLRKMAEYRGKPDAPVTIYRGVPEGVSNINPGDWVTLDPRVAAKYGRVISQEVPAAHVTSWPDSLLEFGYYPP
jgi:hypothetical protein